MEIMREVIISRYDHVLLLIDMAVPYKMKILNIYLFIAIYPFYK